jgi:hypothetical protein
MRFTIVFAMLLLGLFSCNEPEKPKNAEETLRAFQLAINVLDIGTAQKLAVESTKKQLQLLAVDMKMSSAEAVAAKKKTLFTEIKTVSCSKDSLKKFCTICCGFDGKVKNALLIAQHGGWLVEMDFGMSDK